MTHAFRPVPLIAAALLAAWTTGARANDALGAEAVVGTLSAVCTAPGFDIADRIALLDGFAPAGPDQTETLKTQLAQGAMSFDRLIRNGGQPGQPNMTELFVRQLDNRLTEPLDGRRGAMRLFVSQTDPRFGLSIDAIPGTVEFLSCKALIRDPDPALVEALALRFSLVPSVQDPGAQIWTLRSTRPGEETDIDHGRLLTLFRENGAATALSLEFLMTVRPK